MKIGNIPVIGTYEAHDDGRVVVAFESDVQNLVVGEQYDIHNDDDSVVFEMRHLVGVDGNVLTFDLPEELKPLNNESDRISALEEQNAMLMECLLEMSEIVYA